MSLFSDDGSSHGSKHGFGEVHNFSDERTEALVKGICYIAVGVILLIHPQDVLLLAVRVVGWILVALGGLSLANQLRLTGSSSLQGPDSPTAAVSIVEVVAGLVFAINPGLLVQWVFLLVGLVAIVSGARELTATLAMRAEGVSGWLGNLVLACLVLGLGIACLLAPFATLGLALGIAGIALVLNGVLKLIPAFVR